MPSKEAVTQFGVVGVTTAIVKAEILPYTVVSVSPTHIAGFCAPVERLAKVLGLTVMVPEAAVLPTQVPAPADCSS